MKYFNSDNSKKNYFSRGDGQLLTIGITIYYLLSLISFSAILNSLGFGKMDSQHSFWQLGDELRGQSKVSEDHKWLVAASKLAEHTRSKGERMNNIDLSKNPIEMKPKEKFGFQEDNKFENLHFSLLNLDSKMPEAVSKNSSRSGVYNMNAVYEKSNNNNISNLNLSAGNKQYNNNSSKDVNNSSNNNSADKRFKTLPSSEMLPRNEVLGGYIFVCNNDTMQEDLKRQLFGMLAVTCLASFCQSRNVCITTLPLFIDLIWFLFEQLNLVFPCRMDFASFMFRMDAFK